MYIKKKLIEGWRDVTHILFNYIANLNEHKFVPSHNFIKFFAQYVCNLICNLFL